ncbi:MAG: ABC transporter substrate-binding protein [Betaproteobacteria bacterium]|nr:ABC transporter substrate-binding protein [Betaproteobacteria bacterium]
MKLISHHAAALVAALCLAPAAIAAPAPGVTSGEIVIGQDIDLTGSIAVRMKPLMAAADAYIERVNAAGGVHGRRIKVIRTDSANKPDRTKENVKTLVERERVFAMWGISGTGNVAVALPYLTERGVPLVGSTSGADSFYAATHPMLINMKAGYGDEIRRMARHLNDTYMKRVGVIYLDNGFGRQAFKSAEIALKESGLEMVAVAKVKEDSSDLPQAVQAVSKATPSAVMLLTLSGPAPKLIEEYLKSGARPQFLALSIVATDALYKAIGDKARGIIVTQVVPFPFDRSVAISREYGELMRAKGVTEVSHSGMEGLILAKGLVDGLRAAGKDLTRERLIRAFESMRDHDLGGYKLSFSPTDHNGSKFIEITMIGRDGKLVR